MKAQQEKKEVLEDSDFDEKKAKREYSIPCFMYVKKKSKQRLIIYLIRKPFETFKFKDYAPNVFHHLRSMKVPPEQFLVYFIIIA
jgi:hypothetical protein